MNIRQVGGELFHEDGQTDRQTEMDGQTGNGQTDGEWTDRHS